MIIEWNAHMFSADTDRYPFHPRATYMPDPGQRAEDPLADYLARMAEEGIDRCRLGGQLPQPTLPEQAGVQPAEGGAA